MKEEVKNNISKYFEDELYKVNRQIRNNAYELNNLCDKQRTLKKIRHELTKLINGIKGY